MAFEARKDAPDSKTALAAQTTTGFTPAQARDSIASIARRYSQLEKVGKLGSLTIKLEDATVFRGTRLPGQKQLEPSEVTPVDGVFLTLDRKNAIRYAINGPSASRLYNVRLLNPPVLHTGKIKEANILDLRDDKIFSVVYNDFWNFMNALRSNPETSVAMFKALDREMGPAQKRVLESALAFSIGTQRTNEFPHKRNWMGGFLTDYLMGLGFDGIANEGQDIVIFDPKRITELKEEPIASLRKDA